MRITLFASLCFDPCQMRDFIDLCLDRFRRCLGNAVARIKIRHLVPFTGIEGLNFSESERIREADGIIADHTRRPRVGWYLTQPTVDTMLAFSVISHYLHDLRNCKF